MNQTMIGPLHSTAPRLELEPLRGTMIHALHFKTAGCALRVSLLTQVLDVGQSVPPDCPGDTTHISWKILTENIAT
jgi:hypothetical protein